MEREESWTNCKTEIHISLGIWPDNVICVFFTTAAPTLERASQWPTSHLHIGSRMYQHWSRATWISYYFISTLSTAL